MVYYPRPLHTQTVFANSGQELSLFPNSTNAAKTVLSLPMHPYLEEKEISMLCCEIIARTSSWFIQMQ